MALDIHVVAEREDDGLDLCSEFTSGGQDKGLGLPHSDVDRLEDGDGERGSFTSARLRLGNNIAPLGDGENGTLLDSGWFFEVCMSSSSDLR